LEACDLGAGDGGPIAVKGDGFVHSKTGKPVRFWGVNAGAEVAGFEKAAVDRFAKFMAKRGVNLVRYHSPIFARGDFRKVDDEAIARLHYFAAALKREGIYLGVSCYFPLWIKLKPQDGFAGYRDQHPFALLYFNEEFQRIYQGWWRELLRRKNPHTGMTLAEDPAVAFAELVNEDSVFFWTFSPYQNIPEPQMKILEEKFGRWLAARQGSLANALAKWPKGTVRGDDAEAGRAGFLGVWQMANQKSPRARDQLEFLTELQADFYRSQRDFLRGKLGFGGCIQASNWITGDARVLGPLDKHSNATCDFLDRHGYFESRHKGPAASYSLSAGDVYTERSALLFEADDDPAKRSFSLPIFGVEYAGKPSLASEVNWIPPNPLRADMPLVAAAYGALQGTDGYCFFASAAPEWQQTMTKFAIQTPLGVGQFPAAALIYRKGLVKEGPTAARADLKQEDLYKQTGAPLAAPQNLDALRKADLPAGAAIATPPTAALDPLAFLVGKVEFRIGPGSAAARQLDLAKLVDRERKVVTSATGELRWDYGRGLATIDAPAALAATGFLAKAGPVELSEATFDVKLRYGAVALVSLDDKPIRESRRLLLQVASEETNDGWKTTARGKELRIDAVGGPPLAVRKFAGAVTLKGPGAGDFKATPLDPNGRASGPATATIEGRLELAPQTLYYILER
ncbi:MAG TPA: hypothetical protein VNC50_04565, partial [Planctomycetia bacterium]|nr:hypothetical protein [Planctomycetia bacterium]